MGKFYQTSAMLTIMLITQQAVAQKGTVDTLHQSKIYVVSGMGWGFPAGRTAEVFSPKFSSSLGLDISLRNRHYFLYPLFDFLTFGYDQQIKDPDYSYDVEGGRSNFYILNVAGGVRKQWKNLNTYVFAGPGAGYIVEPRSVVMAAENKVKIETVGHLTPNLRAGVGADYKLGSFFLFIEAGWMHSFMKVEERPVNVISLYGGLKTDVTRITNKVVEVLGAGN